VSALMNAPLTLRFRARGGVRAVAHPTTH
jgi:hypothetical protein